MKHDRVREISMEVTVGAFLFMVLLALGVFTIILSRQSLFTITYHMDVRFSSVMGIREGDNIFMRGVVVGKVARIVVEDRDVLVRTALDRRIRLHEDYRIEILPASVLGGRYLQIHEGSDESPLLAEEAEIWGQVPVDLIEQATRAVQMIKTALDEGGLLKNVEEAMANLNEVSARLKRGEGTVGRLLAEDDVYRDLQSVTANLRTISAEIAEGRGTLGRFVADDGKVYADLQAAAANLRQVTDRIAAGQGLLGKLMSQDDTLYADLQETARALRNLATAIDRGEGSLGKLAKSDQLYEEARLLLNEARATIDDFRETAPITTFTSVLFGAF